MESYLVYEFIHHNFDEDIMEGIEFFGLYEEQEEAIKKANERVRIGLKENNVVLSEEISNIENPFEETNCIEMYREDDEIEAPIYSIMIEKLKLERKDENE